MSKRRSEVDDGDRDSGHATDSTDEERELGREDEDYTMEIVWPNILKFSLLHLLAGYSFTLLPHLSAVTWAWLVATYLFSGTSSSRLSSSL